MKVLSIVKDFDIVKDVRASLLPCQKSSAVYQFGFQRGKEALDDGIVIAVGASAHTEGDSMVSQQSKIATGSILSALVRMMKELRAIRLSLLECHVQSTTSQVLRHRFVHSPTDNATRTNIKNNRQVEPAFMGRDVGEVTGSLAIGGSDSKVALQAIDNGNNVRIGTGGDFVTPPQGDTDTMLAHQALDPFKVADCDTL